jgi:hypothetical protein
LNITETLNKGKAIAPLYELPDVLKSGFADIPEN